MKKVKIKITSTSPLLMNNRPMEETSNEKVKKKGDVYDPIAEAEKKAHFDKEIGYYIPSDMIEGSLREGAKNVSKGRGNYKKTILSSVFSENDKIPLNRKDYDTIDKRWGTHPSTGNGILVSRVRFDKWETEFELSFDENRVDSKTLKAIIVEAGEVIGIGSYRPKFGRYKLEKFEIQ